MKILYFRFICIYMDSVGIGGRQITGTAFELFMQLQILKIPLNGHFMGTGSVPNRHYLRDVLLGYHFVTDRDIIRIYRLFHSATFYLEKKVSETQN